MKQGGWRHNILQPLIAGMEGPASSSDMPVRDLIVSNANDNGHHICTEERLYL